MSLIEGYWKRKLCGRDRRIALRLLVRAFILTDRLRAVAMCCGIHRCLVNEVPLLWCVFYSRSSWAYIRLHTAILDNLGWFWFVSCTCSAILGCCLLLYKGGRNWLLGGILLDARWEVTAVCWSMEHGRCYSALRPVHTSDLHMYLESYCIQIAIRHTTCHYWWHLKSVYMVDLMYMVDVYGRSMLQWSISCIWSICTCLAVCICPFLVCYSPITCSLLVSMNGWCQIFVGDKALQNKFLVSWVPRRHSSQLNPTAILRLHAYWTANCTAFVSCCWWKGLNRLGCSQLCKWTIRYDI